MDESTKLKMLKADIDLLKTNDVRDEQLTHLLNVAVDLISREGIALSDTLEDAQLQIMYAAYLYRERANNTAVMPRMLRTALNNRLIGGDGDVTE